MLLFPEETTPSWKKRVPTKYSDPGRIQTRKFSILAAFLIDFSPGKSSILKKNVQPLNHRILWGLWAAITLESAIFPSRILSRFLSTIRKMSSSSVRLSLTLLTFFKRDRQYFVRHSRMSQSLYILTLSGLNSYVAGYRQDHSKQMPTQSVLNCKPSVDEVNR